MVVWSIEENKGYEPTGETVFGMTSTNSSGRSVISYVGFCSDLKKLEQELNEAVGVSAIHVDSEGPATIYALDGTQRKQLSQGVNIVKKSGKSVKILKR